MKLADLSPELIERIKTLDYDQILEKHEGPESWEACFRFHDPEIMKIGERFVLLPVASDRHQNITILRVIVSKEEETLIVFLKDTTFVDEPENEFLYAGFLAICEKIRGTDLYIATVYHEWFMVENTNLRHP